MLQKRIPGLPLPLISLHEGDRQLSVEPQELRAPLETAARWLFSPGVLARACVARPLLRSGFDADR